MMIRTVLTNAAMELNGNMPADITKKAVAVTRSHNGGWTFVYMHKGVEIIFNTKEKCITALTPNRMLVEPLHH